MSCVCKLCTCTGMGLANNEKESPLLYMHVYTMIANKLNCKVQVAVFIFTIRVSHIGGDALQRKSGLFGSNIAQV